MSLRYDQEDFVPTPDGRIHFVKHGDGYPLVLLHSMGTSTWGWHAVIGPLSRHYTCWAFDLLGHGESDKPSRDLSLPDYARSLDHACQALNIHRGHYVGNSVGASLAVEMAVSYPALVDKLVLVGCPVWDPRTGAQRLQNVADDYDDHGRPKRRTAEEVKARGNMANPKPEWVEGINQTRAQAGMWMLKLMEALSYYDIMSRLPLVRASATMIINGEYDPQRDGEKLLYKNIVNASKVVLPGLAHMPQIEDPEAFLSVLLAFLQPEAAR